MKFFNLSINAVILTVFVAVLFPTASEAIPAFARKTNMTCSTCHTAWPVLNAFGRQYKEHGYRLGHLEKPKKTISKDLKWDESLPVSVMLIGRPYDKKDSGEMKLRALHEVELMVAGPMGEKFSSFFEIEAEDEATNDFGFDTGIPTATFTYNHSEALNPQISWGSNSWFDPYNSYSSNRRMTRSSSSVIDHSFGGADNGGKLKSSRQNIAIYGRPSPKFFYGIGISGDAGDAEGEEGNTVTARVAFDVIPSLTIGALIMSGKSNATSTAEFYEIENDPAEPLYGTIVLRPATSTPERDYSRTAIDIQSEFSNFTINAVALAAEDDDVTATTTVKNNAFYVQVMYTAKDDTRTRWVPIIRYDTYEKGGGSEKVNELTLSMNFYLTENVRTMLEFWNKDSDNSANDDDRLTLQVFAAY